MNPRVERIDAGALQPELEALRTIALAAAPGIGAVVLAHARSLIERLRALPESPAGADAADTASGWTALRLALDAAHVEVECASPDGPSQALLVGQWAHGALQSLAVSVGASTWSEQLRAEGETRYASDGTLEGSVDRRRFQELDQRAHAAFERWKTEHPDTRWTCPRCAFRNASEAAACELCGANPTGAAMGDPFGWDRTVAPRSAASAPRAVVTMNLPEDFDAWLQGDANARGDATASGHSHAPAPITRTPAGLAHVDAGRDGSTPAGAPVLSPTAARDTRSGALKAGLVAMLVVALLLLAGGALATWTAIDESRESSDLAVGLLLASVLLSAAAIVALARRLPMQLPLIAAPIVAATGFALGLSNAGQGMALWWWPDLVMDAGIAGFLGSLIGWWLRRRLHRA